MGIGVRQDKDAVIHLNRAGFSSCVARQARMADRIYVPSPHVLAHLESRSYLHVPACGYAFRDHREGFLGAESRSHLGLARRRCCRVDLGLRYQTALDDHRKESYELPRVIAQAQVFFGRNELNLMARYVDVPLAPCRHRAPKSEQPPLPWLVKHGLVFFGHDGAHVLHPAHVMDTVHTRPLLAGFGFAGDATLATPIIESPVTRAASASSLSFSVLAGRSGRTRYLTSAVLSQTRTSTS